MMWCENGRPHTVPQDFKSWSVTSVAMKTPLLLCISWGVVEESLRSRFVFRKKVQSSEITEESAWGIQSSGLRDEDLSCIFK